MNDVLDYPLSLSNRYSAKNNRKPVVFICRPTDANDVYLVGDFNDWDPWANRMKRQVDGAWRLEVLLNHGHHQYLFLVDGKPALDPQAYGIARNEKNEKVSLVAVS
jgi:1,4-alpha-glucan branching enzyme